jgi:hypothetical protein
VITGFNTDIEHDGVVYHVQTEDKGLDSPLILSLVYSGGTILASKRSRYEDLIAEGFDEEVLSQRLKRQHRLICAAINAGRLEDLKRMGAKAKEEVAAAEAPPDLVSAGAVTGEDTTLEVERDLPPVEVNGQEAEFEIDRSYAFEPPPKVEVIEEATDGVTAEAQDVLTDSEPEAADRPVKKGGHSLPKDSAYSLYDPRREEPESEVKTEDGSFALSLLDDEDEFRAGESYLIRVLVEDRTGRKRKPLSGVGVSLKILGTAFRPQIFSVKTERDGVATIDAAMPSFTSGRAAVLIRVVVKGEPREVRRIIHPAE